MSAHMHSTHLQSLMQPQLLGARRCRIITTAGKGFGKPQTQQAPKKERKSGPANKAKPQRQPRQTFIEDQEEDRAQPAVQPQSREQRELTERFRGSAEAQRPVQDSAADSEFEQRLQRLAKRTPAQQEAEQRDEPQDILALEPQIGRPAKPPPERRAPDNDESDETSWFAKAGVAAGSLILVAIFVASSFKSDFVSSTVQSPADSSGQAQLGASERKELEAQAAKYQEQLTAEPDSVEALEGAAVFYAKLGDLKKATSLLTQLSEKRPQDIEVWRLLAETQALQGNQAAASTAYKTANEKSPGANIDLLSAWTDSLVKEKKQQQAVDIVKAARQKAPGGLAVDLDLLQGRIFSQWKGHEGDALAIYDRLAESAPDDFRPPLAKGLILKGAGRKGDAARYFMKARYLAPASARAAVDELVARQQLQ